MFGSKLPLTVDNVMEEKGEVAAASIDNETDGPFTKDKEQFVFLTNEDADMGAVFDQLKPWSRSFWPLCDHQAQQGAQQPTQSPLPA